jgi:hypothetical protein
MRLFGWPGISALACAAVGGFLAGEAVHSHDPAVLQICEGGELCDALPRSLSPPELVEQIEQACPPTLVEAFGPQSMEPPLADAPPDSIRTVNFELPAGAPVGPEPRPYMPYVTDDGAPAPFPALGDVPLLNPPMPMSPPVADPGNPIYQAVKRFMDYAVKPPERQSEEVRRKKALENQAENERQLAEEWRRIWRDDQPPTMVPAHVVTDKVPIGKPPVSEHPSTVTPEKPTTPPAKANTTEVRPGDLPPKPTGDQF